MKYHKVFGYVKITFFLVLFAFSGCSTFNTLFAPQQMSENYALMPGVECDAPEAVDADMNTISNSTRIVISLPEKKSIRRIVIYNTNISNFILYEYKGNAGDWKIINSFKGNTQTKIVVNTQVMTDKIRLFVSDTSGTIFIGPGVERDENGFLRKVDSQVNAKPEIQEIELYGFVDKVGKPQSNKPIF
ncbi:MAG: hypothetical protein QG641_2656 [Candidatus Poribacteria bacterium]|nr:hypothetical protein [Candidatus Poribacteria bacterium]